MTTDAVPNLSSAMRGPPWPTGVRHGQPRNPTRSGGTSAWSIRRPGAPKLPSMVLRPCNQTAGSTRTRGMHGLLGLDAQLRRLGPPAVFNGSSVAAASDAESSDRTRQKSTSQQAEGPRKLGSRTATHCGTTQRSNSGRRVCLPPGLLLAVRGAVQTIPTDCPAPTANSAGPVGRGPPSGREYQVPAQAGQQRPVGGRNGGGLELHACRAA